MNIKEGNPLDSQRRERLPNGKTRTNSLASQRTERGLEVIKFGGNLGESILRKIGFRLAKKGRKNNNNNNYNNRSGNNSV
jgi:hypothetical protein